METKKVRLSKRTSSADDQEFNFLPKLNSIHHIEVYDNDKYLILVGMNKDKTINNVVKFDRNSMELDCETSDKLLSTEQVTAYISKVFDCKKIEKYYKFRAYAVFGIYQFYKLTYISFVKGAKEVAKFVDEPIYEIKECEMFAIQSKKYYK